MHEFSITGAACVEGQIMKFASRAQLVDSIDDEWQRLWDMLAEFTDREMVTLRTGKSKWTIKDVLMHLYEWHSMFLRWYKEGLTGNPVMPAKGYGWGDVVALNKAIYKQHKDVPLASAKRRVKSSHARVLKMARSLSQQELLTPGYYAWCGKTKKLPLSSYLHPNSCGHYRWAQKRLKRYAKAKS